MNTERKDVYSRITSQIVASLEQGVRPRGHSWDASAKANRQAGERGRCSRVLSLGQGALDHRCQYSRRWWVEAVTSTVRSAIPRPSVDS